MPCSNHWKLAKPQRQERKVGKRSFCPPSTVDAWATLRFYPPYPRAAHENFPVSRSAAIPARAGIPSIVMPVVGADLVSAFAGRTQFLEFTENVERHLARRLQQKCLGS